MRTAPLFELEIFETVSVMVTVIESADQLPLMLPDASVFSNPTPDIIGHAAEYGNVFNLNDG